MLSKDVLPNIQAPKITVSKRSAAKTPAPKRPAPKRPAPKTSGPKTGSKPSTGKTAAPTPQTGARDPDFLCALGEEAAHKGYVARALACALGLGGDAIRMLRIVAALHQAQGPEAAASLLADIIEAVPENPLLLIEAAKLAAALGWREQAIAQGGAALLAAPGDVPITCGFATLLRDLGQVELSIDVLVDAIARHGSDAEVLRHLGYALAILAPDGRAPRLGLDPWADLLERVADVPEVAALLGRAGPKTLHASAGLPTDLAPDGADDTASLPQAVQSNTLPIPPAVDLPATSPVMTREDLALVAAARACAADEGAPKAQRHAALGQLVALGMASASEIVALAAALPEAEAHQRVRLLDLAIALHPHDATVWAERAKALWGAGHVLAALDDIAVAYDRDPLAQGIVGLYADLLAAADRMVPALAVLERHLTEVPEDAPLRLKAAQMAHLANRPAVAEAHLVALSRLGAQAGLAPAAQAEAEVLRVRCLVARGALAEAEGILRRSLAHASDPEVQLLLLEIAITMTWTAIPDYVDPKRVTRIEDGFAAIGPRACPPEIMWQGVRLFRALGRFDVASRLASDALRRLAPRAPADWPDAFVVLVAEMLGHRRLPEAMRTDPAALASALMGRGNIALATAARSDARVMFQIAAMLDPKNAAARYSAGFASLEAQDVSAAARNFRGLERIFPEDMAQVAWPATGQFAWPQRPLGLAAAFAQRLRRVHDWPRITVITPSFEQGQFIEDTILSILHQEYPNLEYIVVDGQSADGTLDVLNRYRDRLDHLIIEPDEGQTDAINKGLALATGDLITWINSDDMLAPGALFALAEGWLNTNADLIFGACLPHVEHRFQLSNLPGVRQDTFTQQNLGDIFGRWLQGFFFYQPEVIFSRRILQAVGGRLDASLHYTMDYDFWMRCARAGARVEPIYWPIALFRHHAAQKTANLAHCVIEQAQVRDAVLDVAPPFHRARDVLDRVGVALGRAMPRIGVVSSRMDKIFSPDSAADLAAYFAAPVTNGRHATVELVAKANLLTGPVDLLIKLVHLQNDVQEIEAVRQARPDTPVVGWFWDNHHHLFHNHDVAGALDVAVPGHAFAAGYLRNHHAVHGPSVPLCITQWSQREARQSWAHLAGSQRRDDLYGGFVRYPFARSRNRLIEALHAQGNSSVYFLEEGDLSRYFGQSQPQRLAEWGGYKCSVCLPLEGDLSQRLFDALLSGQVPIVAPDIADLDAVLPADLRHSLPVIVFDAYTPEAVRDAHARAVAAFDAGGPEAAAARHRFALDHHTFPPRIAGLLDALDQMVEKS